MNITPKIFLVASTALYMLPVPLLAMDIKDEVRTAGRAAPSAAGAAAGAGAGAEELRGVGIASVAKLANPENPSGGDEKKEIAKSKEALEIAEIMSGYSYKVNPSEDYAKQRIKDQKSIEGRKALAAKLSGKEKADVDRKIQKAENALRAANAAPEDIKLAIEADSAVLEVPEEHHLSWMIDIQIRSRNLQTRGRAACAEIRTGAKEKIDSAVGLAAKLPKGRTADVDVEIAKARQALMEAEAASEDLSPDLTFKAERAADAAWWVASQRALNAPEVAKAEAEIERAKNVAATLPLLPATKAFVEGEIAKAMEALIADEARRSLCFVFHGAAAIATKAVDSAKAIVEAEKLLRMSEQVVPMVLPAAGEKVRMSVVKVRKTLEDAQVGPENLKLALEALKAAREAIRRAAYAAVLTDTIKETEELIATAERDLRLEEIILKGVLAGLSPAQKTAIEQMIEKARETLGKIKAEPEKSDSVMLMRFMFGIMNDLSSIAGVKTKGEAIMDGVEEVTAALPPRGKALLVAPIAKAKEILRKARAEPENLHLEARANDEIGRIFSAMTAIEPPEAVDANQIGEVDGFITRIEKALVEVWSGKGMPLLGHSAGADKVWSIKTKIKIARTNLEGNLNLLRDENLVLQKLDIKFASQVNAEAHEAADEVAQMIGSRRETEEKALLAKKAIEREEAMKALEALIEAHASPKDLVLAFATLLKVNQADLSADEGRAAVLAMTPGASAGAAAAAGAGAGSGSGSNSNAGISTDGVAGVAKDIGSTPGVARDAVPIGASAAAAAGAGSSASISTAGVAGVAKDIGSTPGAAGGAAPIRASAAAAAGIAGNGSAKEAAAATGGGNDAFKVTGPAADKASNAYDRWKNASQNTTVGIQED